MEDTMKRALLLCCAVWFCSLAAAWGEQPVYDIPLVDAAPVLDGSLAETAWLQAVPVDDFLQRFPVEGAQSHERTEVRMIHTSRALYIGFRAFDTRPADIRAT